MLQGHDHQSVYPKLYEQAYDRTVSIERWAVMKKVLKPARSLRTSRLVAALLPLILSLFRRF